MPMTPAAELDVLIFGGGVAGLWLLDHLRRRRYRTLLLEANALGSGQTVASQGIVHGGLKYSLRGALTPSAREVREMPALWRQCLAGRAAPDLRRTTVRAEYCHIWQTRQMSSRLAMLGARRGLRVKPVTLAPEQRPPALRECPGVVARLDEQVLDTASLIADLAEQHRPSILRVDGQEAIEFGLTAAGKVESVQIASDELGARLRLHPVTVVFAAGMGAERLRAMAGLHPGLMQRRPLHMVMARGDLPMLYGHCVDGLHTRATITTAHDRAGRVVWQIGGQIAEDGVKMAPDALIRHARSELDAILPGVRLADADWATYSVDRGEGVTQHGLRPAGVSLDRQGNTITAWPTKMVLAPVLADRIIRILPDPGAPAPFPQDIIEQWPRPDIALPPWEDRSPWTAAD